jgi:acyl-CoA reductase-like NAD-dependent aldehyde dehydrogenase
MCDNRPLTLPVSAARYTGGTAEQEVSTMTITCNLYINGQWHDAEGRRTFTRRHPAHDEAASVAAAASLADGKRCVEAAACAFPLWRDTAPAERRRLLLEAAEQMLLREAKFIAAMAAETGATAHWAGFNVHLAADILREAAALTTQIEGQIIPSNVPGNLAMGVRQGAAWCWAWRRGTRR